VRRSPEKPLARRTTLAHVVTIRGIQAPAADPDLRDVDAISNALTGMQAATRRFDAAAHAVSTVDTPEEQPPGVDLATEMVSLLTARTTYAANARVVAAAREAGHSLLDALA
jgi:hypothetical protein